MTTPAAPENTPAAGTGGEDQPQGLLSAAPDRAQDAQRVEQAFKESLG